MVEPEPRPEVSQLPAVPHGAPDFEELERMGMHPDQVVDFSVNSNPYGPAPGLQTALSAVPVSRYPDREAIALRRKISTHHQIPLECILAGNGSAELLQLTALTYLTPESRVLISGPTFGEYKKAAALMGADVLEIRADPADGFQPALAGLRKELNRQNPELVFICNPNNPTGQLCLPPSLNELIESYPGTLFVIDEAYLSFTKGSGSVINPEQKNLLVLKSMTKDYSLAGLRLGYAVGNPRIIRSIASVRPPWNVNAYAQAAGIHALSSSAFLKETIKKIQDSKALLIKDLQKLGYTPVPSSTHFFLLPVENAANFRAQLLRQGIQVRDCTSFGLPGYVRIATLTPEKNQQLLQAISFLL